MQLLKYILAFITCTPLWAVEIWLLPKFMFLLLDLVDSLEERGIYLVLKILAGLLVSVVIPIAFIFIGIALWGLAGLLFGIS